MTRKDYVLIAKALHSAELDLAMLDTDSHAEYIAYRLSAAAMTESVADALASDNERFDRARFMEAARITDAEAASSGADFDALRCARIVKHYEVAR